MIDLGKMKRVQKSIHPDEDAYYEKMGLRRDLVEIWEDGEVAERVSDPAVWELMYFGKTSADEKYRGIE